MKHKIWEYTETELKKLPETELIKILNEMAIEVYKKDYFQVFNYDYDTDLIQNYRRLKKKYELQHPIIVEKIDGNSGQRNFLDIWTDIWNMRITQQPENCILYGLCAMSQIFNNVITMRGIEDDIRLHLCIIMPTASGKSEGNNMIIEFCDAVDFSYSLPGEFSPATLIGTVNKSIIDSNIAAKAFTEESEEWRDPKQYGILDTKNFIMFDEGEAIMHTTPRTEGAQRILQLAMNRHGSATNTITNDLVNGTVEINPNCNVIITSFYQDHFKETLLNRGMLQRMIIFYKSENDIDRHKIRNYMYDNMIAIKKGETAEDGVKKVNNKLQTRDALFEEIKQETKKLRIRHVNTKYVYLHEDALERLKEKTIELQNIIPNMTPYQVDIWETLISRIAPTFIKVAAIYALMDYRETIEANDVDKSAAILSQTLQSIAFFMIGKISDTKTTDGYMSIYKRLKISYKHNKMSEPEWINIVINLFGLSVANAKKQISNLKAGKKLMLRIDINNGEKKLELV